MSKQDRWAAWLLRKRFGNDPERFQQFMNDLYPIRDRILEHSDLQEGGLLLDVGSGDGLIAFGALQQVDKSRVIASDISHDLLTHAKQLAREMGAAGRYHFVLSPAERLALKSGSVDMITTRSVLIYVADKDAAFSEFYRLLRPGGRISLFEPINTYFQNNDPTRFWFFDATPVQDAAAKVRALYEQLQLRGEDPMLDFDERDLLTMAEKVGFQEIHLRLEANIDAMEPMQWETLVNSAGNPKIPTLAEAMDEVLSPAEREALVAHLKPQAEAGQGIRRLAVAYLWARK